MTPPPPITAQAFSNAMSAAVTGVYLVTTDGPAGRLGLTVSSMASVSADPPTVLVSINRDSPMVAALLHNGVFGLSALGAHHAELGDIFAGRSEWAAPYDFDAASWDEASSGVPLLADAAARFACHVTATVDAGSHVVVLGTVHEASRGAVCALGYTRRGYARVVTQARPLSADLRSRQSAYAVATSRLALANVPSRS